MWADTFRKRLLPLLMVLSVFVQTGAIQNVGGVFDFYWYYPLYFFVFIQGVFRLRFSLCRPLLGIIIILFVSSLLAYAFQPYPKIALLKQTAAWAFILLVWWFFLSQEKANSRLSDLFRTYVIVAVVAAFLTLPEQFLHQLGLHLTPKKGGWLGLYRCYSICIEPFTLGTLLLPAFLILLSLRLQNSKTVPLYALPILTIGIFLTFSFAVWIALLTGLAALSVLHIKTMGKYTLPLMVVIGLGLVSYSGSRARIVETAGLFSFFPSLPPAEVLHRSNSSSRAVYLNAICAYEQVKQHPLTGGGLGSHATAYAQYIEIPLVESGVILAHYNQVDAGSAWLRWLSEMGLLGLLLAILWVRKILQTTPYSWIIGAMAYLLSVGLHGGNYFHFGLQAWIILTGFIWQKNERPGFDKNP